MRSSGNSENACPARSSGARRPAHAKTHGIRRGRGRGDPLRELPRVQRKVHAGSGVERQRSPEAAVHFHERGLARRAVVAKLDHRDALPLERAQQPHRVVEELRVDRFRNRDHGDAARGRILREAPMLEGRDQLALRDEQLDADALTTVIRLEEQPLAEARLRREGRAQLLRAVEGARLEVVRCLAALVARVSR